MQDSLAKSGFPLLHMHGIPSQIVDSSIRNKCLPPVTEGFSAFERFAHSTGTRRFNYGRGTQREYSSKPLKHSIVTRILVFKR